MLNLNCAVFKMFDKDKGMPLYQQNYQFPMSGTLRRSHNNRSYDPEACKIFVKLHLFKIISTKYVSAYKKVQAEFTITESLYN
jgi:hypothetical protein